ncbi:MAG: MFS transporter [Anaerolineae bacterium]
MSLFKNKALWSLTLGHFGVDMYAGMMPLLLVYLSESLHLTYGQVGLAVMAYVLCSSLSQPLFGYLADRFGGRLLAGAGLLWIAAMTGTIGFVQSYTTLMVLAPLAGLGAGAFHPQGAANASLASGERKGSGMSIFLLGGNSGYAAGPLLGGIVFEAVGLRGTALIALIGFLLAPWLYRATSAIAVKGGGHLTDHVVQRVVNGVSWLGLGTLMVVLLTRSWVHTALTTYIPQFYKSQGYSAAFASRVLFAFLFPVAIGGLLGGFLSDRIGRRRVIFLSLFLLTPLMLLQFQAGGATSFLVAPLLGMAAGASLPITIVIAQELLPRSLGVASGLAMGFSFVTGGVGVALTGFVADRIGLLNGLNMLAVLPLLVSFLCLGLPSARERRAVGLGASS